MPTVPYSPVPSILPSTQGVRGLSVPNAGPDAFGAGIGRGLGVLGADTERAADNLTQTAIASQNILTDAAARDITAQGLTKLGAIESAYRMKTGAQAADAFPQFQQDMMQARQEILGAAPDPWTRRKVDEQIARQFGYGLMNGSTHLAQQSVVFQHQAQQAQVQTLGQNAAIAPGFDQWKALTGQQEQTIRQNPNGLPAEALDIQVRDERSKSYVERSKTLAQLDPEAAFREYQTVKDQLNPATQASLESFLHSAIKTKASYSIANDAANGILHKMPTLGQDKLDPTDARNLAISEVVKQGLVGVVPADGAKYGIKTGSAEEWGNYFAGLGFHESQMTNSNTGDGGTSKGLYQLSNDDALRYGLNNGKPFTDEQLADPRVNTAAAVAITKALLTKAGSITGGPGQYWGPINKEGWTPGTGRDTGLPWAEWAKTKATNGTPAITPLSTATTEAQFAFSRQALQAELQRQYPNPGDADFVQSTLTHYDTQWANIQAIRNKMNAEAEGNLLLAVNGNGKDKGLGTGQPMADFSQLQADPQLFRLFNQLPAIKQNEIQQLIKKNATSDDAQVTVGQLNKFSELKGRITEGDQTVSTQDILDAKLPKAKVWELTEALVKRDNSKPASPFGGLQQRLDGTLELAGINKSQDPAAYYNFANTFNEAYDKQAQQLKRPLNDDEAVKLAGSIIAQHGFAKRQDQIPSLSPKLNLRNPQAQMEFDIQKNNIPKADETMFHSLRDEVANSLAQATRTPVTTQSMVLLNQRLAAAKIDAGGVFSGASTFGSTTPLYTRYDDLKKMLGGNMALVPALLDRIDAFQQTNKRYPTFEELQTSVKGK